MKIFSFFLLALLPLSAAAGIVYYKDAEGNLHAAESMDQIPEKFRSRTKSLASTENDRSRLTLQLKREGNALLVPVTFGEEGVEATLILDTGASITLIPKRIAEKLRFRETGKIELQTVSGVAQGSMVEVPVMAVGRLKVRKMRVAVYDIPHSGLGEGLLGLDFLNNFHMTMDSQKGVIHLEPK